MEQFLVIFLRFLVITLWLLIIGRVLISWVDPRASGPVARFLHDTTEPILAPVRRLLPQTGFVDLSPLVVMLVLGLLVRLVV